MGLLSVLAVLCLVLLLADSFRETISLLIALREWLSYCYRREETGLVSLLTWFRLAASPAASLGPHLSAFQLPLLI